MKKFFALVLSFLLVLSLVACGGPDRQPAIDAFNATSAAFNEFSAVVNENIEEYPDDFVDLMIDMAELLNEYQGILSDDSYELSEDDLNAMIEWFGTVDTWIADSEAELGI